MQSNISSSLREAILPKIPKEKSLAKLAETADPSRNQVSGDSEQRIHEEKYRIFVEQSADAIWRFEIHPPVPVEGPENEQIEAIYANAVLAESSSPRAGIYGFANNTAMQGAPLSHFLSYHKHQVEQWGQQFLRSGYRLTEVETSQFDNQGNCYWFLNNVTGIVENGYLVRLWGAQNEITRLKAAEQELRDSQERLASALRGGDLDLWDYDLRTNQVTFNQHWGQALGYTREEVCAWTKLDFWTSLVHPEDLAAMRQSLIDHLRGGNLFFRTEFRLQTKSGAWKWISASGQVVERTPEGRALRAIGVHKDVTAHKQLEEQLHQSQKMEAIGRLAGGIAHDFNNLLTVMSGYTALSLATLRPGDPLLSNLTEVKRAAERAASLTQQLLAFSRKQILQPRVLDLNEVVAHTDRMLRRLIGEHIELSIVLTPDLWRIKADPHQLGQILVNLAVNARDAMPEHGCLTIETANVQIDSTYAENHAVAPGPYVMLAVSDTGCGMDADTLSNIFEPFFTTKETGMGTGLGLATVYGIVKQSGGHIWVYSELTHGTTFKVYLPRTSAPGEVLAEPSPAAKLPRGNEAILLVEDDSHVRQLAADILNSYGYCVVEAANGQEALTYCQNSAFQIDLLVTDVIMPTMSGRHLVEEVKKLRPQLPTLYMSGYTEDAIVRHGVLEQGAAFLSKPFGPEVLVQHVRRLLDLTT